MAKTFLLIVLTGLLCLRSSVGAADEAVWKQYMRAGLSAYQRGDYAEATKQWEAALKEAQDFGAQKTHPAISLYALAELYRAQGRYGEAEPLYKRSLAIREKALGPKHPDVALSLNQLAGLYYFQGRYEDAEPLYKRSLAIKEKALGPEHPDVAGTLSNLAELYRAQGRYGEALPFIRKATAIRRTRAILASGERSSGALSEQRTQRPDFVGHVRLLSAVAGKKPDERLGSEAFEVAQLARASNTAQAVARMAARFASGNNKLARLARTRQDALQRWQFVDAELLKAVGKPTGERSADREARLREELSGLDKRIAELDTTLLQRTFPEYKDLTSPAPLVMQEAQKLLAPQEALLAYLVGEKESYLWLVRKDKSDFRRIEIGKQALDKMIKALRLQLDASSGVRPFAVKEAHELYRRIFAPAEPLLKDATHVIVVPDGALQSLPFGVLVIEVPKALISSLSQYRDIAWLAKKYALTVLPSESSLRALRRFAKGTSGDQPFTGFGDPVLEGGGQIRGANVAALFSRGAIADVNEVRQLPRLQETADELYAMAGALGTDKRYIHLRQAATETNVKRLDFTPYRTLAFSTHGLMAGEFKGLAEPALVLTPPKRLRRERISMTGCSPQARSRNLNSTPIG
jgi:tetratricopeptide (TPR) repeat protein